MFQPVRNKLLILGIKPYQKYPFNLKNLFALFMLSMGIFLNCVHLFCEANTFKEYADSVCASSSMMVATIIFAIIIWKTIPLHHSMDNLEESVTKSEWTALIVCIEDFAPVTIDSGISKYESDYFSVLEFKKKTFCRTWMPRIKRNLWWYQWEYTKIG